MSGINLIICIMMEGQHTVHIRQKRDEATQNHYVEKRKNYLKEVRFKRMSALPAAELEKLPQYLLTFTEVKTAIEDGACSEDVEKDHILTETLKTLFSSYQLPDTDDIFHIVESPALMNYLSHILRPDSPPAIKTKAFNILASIAHIGERFGRVLWVNNFPKFIVPALLLCDPLLINEVFWFVDCLLHSSEGVCQDFIDGGVFQALIDVCHNPDLQKLGICEKTLDQMFSASDMNVINYPFVCFHFVREMFLNENFSLEIRNQAIFVLYFLVKDEGFHNFVFESEILHTIISYIRILEEKKEDRLLCDQAAEGLVQTIRMMSFCGISNNLFMTDRRLMEWLFAQALTSSHQIVKNDASICVHLIHSFNKELALEPERIRGVVAMCKDPFTPTRTSGMICLKHCVNHLEDDELIDLLKQDIISQCQSILTAREDERMIVLTLQTLLNLFSRSVLLFDNSYEWDDNPVQTVMRADPFLENTLSDLSLLLENEGATSEIRKVISNLADRVLVYMDDCADQDIYDDQDETRIGTETVNQE